MRLGQQAVRAVEHIAHVRSATGHHGDADDRASVQVVGTDLSDGRFGAPAEVCDERPRMLRFSFRECTSPRSTSNSIQPIHTR